MQRAADAAAMATCWEFSQELADGNGAAASLLTARPTGSQYCAANLVAHKPVNVDTNSANSPGGGILFGYINDFSDANAVFDSTATNKFNAARIQIEMGGGLNDELPMFFSRIFGHTRQSITAEATAAVVRDVLGFTAPADGSNLGLIPIALDLDTWNDMLAGSADDDWTWNSETGQISSGSDGILEVNLYPQGTGAPGNRGMVDIGSNNNSTADIARQLTDGVSAADLAHHGGELKLDANGELFLNGDTGISAGVKDELTDIKGLPRTIPIFSDVNGPGNNATFTIVKWAGIRIMEVKLTGPMNNKRVIIQPAGVVSDGVIPSPETGTSDYVFSRVVLVK